MNIKYYPFPNHLIQDIQKVICGEQTGVLRNLIFIALNNRFHDPFIVASGSMPDYHKVLLGFNTEIQYHLGGYGKFYEEAIIRYIGEGVERYSSLTSPFTMQNEFRYATYIEMEKEGEVVLFKYLDTYSEEDYKKLGRLMPNIKKLSKEEDTVGWVKCNSLFDCNKKIWMPIQMIFTGYYPIRQKDTRFTLGFSKGTAAHTSIKKSILNAIFEFIEIDACMINWYCKIQSEHILVDNDIFFDLFPNLFSINSQYEVLATNISITKELGVYALAVQIINKEEKEPFAVYGASAGINPTQCLYRALTEAISIQHLAIYGKVYSPQQYLVRTDKFTDLDTNVAYFASSQDSQKKRDLFYSLTNGQKLLSTMEKEIKVSLEEQFIQVINGLKNFSKYAVYLDITPFEVKDKGWNVMRVFIPELVSMSLPGIPCSEHPRIKEFGGIKNEYPHPLP